MLHTKNMITMNEFELPQETTSNSLEVNESFELSYEGLNPPKPSANPTVIVHGAVRMSEVSIAKEHINDTKKEFTEALHDSTDKAIEIGEKIQNGISDFCVGVYENSNDYFTDVEQVKRHEFSQLKQDFSETRDFGIQECSDAAIKVFTPEVIDTWGSMSNEQRIEIAKSYANEVAEAFELVNYAGVIFESMEPGTYGSNNGDGSIHISDTLVESWTTPFTIMDTIAHELRHQYQSECIDGYHNVSDEVRNEWAVASAIYNYDQPSCYDPWGYTYNPLEIDSRYAGETVVRNVTSQLINDLVA